MTDDNTKQERSDELNNKDVLSIDVTVIVGLLILFTLSNFVEAQSSSTNPFYKFVQALPFVRIVASTTIIPFLVSAIYAISFRFSEVFTSSSELADPDPKIARDAKEKVDKRTGKKKTWEIRRHIAFLTGLKWMKAGFIYLLIVMIFFILTATIAFYYYTSPNS